MADTGERRSRRTANPSGTHLAGSELGPALPPTLDDLGVTTDESHRWQAVASVPPEERQAYVAEARQREQEVTRAGLLRFARPAPVPTRSVASGHPSQPAAASPGPT